MPLNSGSNETAKLMRDIGNSVNMDYGGDGSSADTETEARNSFVNHFGYSSNAKFISYSISTVVQQLKWKYPVLMRGGDKKYWGGLIPYYSDGHAWVCDGFKSITYHDSGNSYLRFHMNWGWNGTNNGWYSCNNFNPGGYDFNYKTGCVINIHP